MLKGKSSYLLGFGITIAFTLDFTLISLLLWPDLIYNVLSTDKFEPHGGCFMWEPSLVRLHSVSDTLIGLAYFSISITLAYFVKRTRRNLPFRWVFLAFGTFIIACGSTHLIDVWTLWTPIYWLAGGVKLITALVSVGTALALPPLVPQALRLIEIAKVSEERKRKLEAANQELAALYEKTKELDQLKTEFFTNVSHELRTPLTLILGPIRQLLTTELTEGQRRNLGVVERNASTLLKQVNDLLDLAKLEANKMEVNYTESDLARLVHLTAAHFELLAYERQVSFKVEAPAFVAAQIDAEKMQRVLLNLLSNAFKFTPVGGTIRYTLSSQGTLALITIADSGPGVLPELRQKIFERYQQGENTTIHYSFGSGLGLSIAKEFVELQGGTLKVGERPGGGAIFRVELPLVAGEEEEVGIQRDETESEKELAHQVLEELRGPLAEEVEAESAADPDLPLVLVVEDNSEMRWLLVETLATDYRIATARDGREGLKKALARPPDLILSDMMMPVMRGDQLIREVRSHPELDTVPIVLLTAKTDENLRIQLLREGAQDYLLKPFSAEELRARVGNLVKIKRARQFLQQELTTQTHDVVTLAKELAVRNRELQVTLEALQKSENRFRRLVEADIIGVILADFEGNISEANSAFLEMVGYNRDELLSGVVRWDRMTPPEYSAQDTQVIKRVIETGTCPTWEKEYIRKDGSRVPVLSGVALLDEPSQNQFICFVLDITARKEVEEALRLAISARDEFLSVAAHELKTPVTSLRGYAQFVTDKYSKGETPDPNQMSRSFKAIDRQSEKLSLLIDRLLDISRIESGRLVLELEVVDLSKLVTEVVMAAQVNTNNHTLILEAPPTLSALVDPLRFEQVMTNLISNAIKYSPEGGQVSLTISLLGSERIQLAVRDWGIGISPDHRPHIFERFYQAHADAYFGGMGLGLYISSQIVELHGGRIKAEFPPDGGTCFIVVLPVNLNTNDAGGENK
ncbi:MAG: response regulator [Chloroflexi bacterium]|nr:response regulator [Chloroflexota bacterium]